MVLTKGNVISILFGLVFLFSGISKMFPIDIFSAKLLEFGLGNWTLARFTSRAIISLELSIGLACIMPSQLRKIGLASGFFLTLFFTAILAYQYYTLGNQENCHCFGDWLPLSTRDSIIKNIFICLLALFGLKHLQRKSNRWAKVLVLASLPVAMLTICIISPPIDIHSHDGINDAVVGTELPAWIRNDKSDIKILVVSANCEHCKQVGYKLGSSNLAGLIDQNDYFITVDGDSSDVGNYLNYCRLEEFDRRRISQRTFLQLTQGSYPKLLIINSDTISHQRYPWELMELPFD